jgi:ERCC4-type nuclease
MLELYRFKTDKQLKEVLKSIQILVDTREQSHQHILDVLDKKKISWISHKLDHGDFSFMLPANEEFGITRDLYFDKKVVVERKGCLEEVSGNFTNDRARIEKELSLYKGEMHLLIEGAGYSDIANGNYNTKYNPKSFLATWHSFTSRYGLNYMFINDKEHSAMFIYYVMYYYLRNILK